MLTNNGSCFSADASEKTSRHADGCWLGCGLLTSLEVAEVGPILLPPAADALETPLAQPDPTRHRPDFQLDAPGDGHHERVTKLLTRIDAEAAACTPEETAELERRLGERDDGG